ncbi:hypothetical protein MSAN_00863200 [Mycena sanguinolenta]|uniref:Uncharacterized protein n=1 Tax=Mycena sanguinolenta TaxID=230812 RepID=A0A8H7DDX2_9AGAR|nr:hypothetical protein MSAN_00863200 [Mycena sanguinolenta]
MDPCVGPSGAPQMNTDISGIGVRVSFYLQTLFLSCLCARSGSPDEIAGALYTLLFTNTAMAVTALILGFQPNPEITFHDGLIVFYLLNLSWVTVYFSLPAVAKSPNVKLLYIFSILQSYTIFAFAFAMLITAHSFGQHSQCNHHASIVIFRPFHALPAGRIVCLVVTAVIFTLYTGMLIKDNLPPAPKRILQWIQQKVTKEVPTTAEQELPPPPGAPPLPRHAPQKLSAGKVEYHARKAPTVPKEYDLQIAWNIVIEIFVVLILWGMAVMNTELLIRWNHFPPSNGQSLWQFGQVLPMFLVVLPLTNLITAFRDLGLRPLPMRPVISKA